MSHISRSADMSAHPDVAEMRERYARMVEGPRAVAIDGLLLLTGLYAAISPWVVHFHASNANVAVNNLLCGITLGLLGLGLATAPARLHRLAWVSAAIGIWMIITPWVVSAGHSAHRGIIWNNVWIGAVAFVLGMAAQGMILMNARRSPART